MTAVATCKRKKIIIAWKVAITSAAAKSESESAIRDKDLGPGQGDMIMLL